MPAIDVSAIPLVDDHCHGVYQQQRVTDAFAWRQHFTESTDAGLQQSTVTTTAFYRRLLLALASFFECEAEEKAVLAARQAYDERTLLQKLWQEANIEALVLDTGHPAPSLIVSGDDVTALVGCRVAPLLRVELVMQDLIAEEQTLSAVIEKLRAHLTDVRAQGYVGLKSIVAYRTGLAIDTWNRDEVEEAFKAARYEAQALGSVRLGYKPLLDTLLHIVFEQAARQELPIQFHTGYGDADADMLLANPLHLRRIFERQEYRAMPVILLHESYPYTRQGAYLSAIYDNVYLDLSYGIPFLGYREMREFTGAALDVAPTAKLLYASDGIGIPEIHWLSARDGRRILAEALADRVDTGEIRINEVEDIAASILRENARKLYQL
jgi:predicted TIM-barrel fold metal-dependent hydrolase